MKKWIKNIVTGCLKPITNLYIDNITKCLNNPKSEMAGSEDAKPWINQLQGLMDFVDGIHNTGVTTNV